MAGETQSDKPASPVPSQPAPESSTPAQTAEKNNSSGLVGSSDGKQQTDQPASGAKGAPQEPRTVSLDVPPLVVPDDNDDGHDGGDADKEEDAEVATPTTKSLLQKRQGTGAKRESGSSNAAAMRRQARRAFLQSNSESRTESDLLFLDELLYGCQACKLLTRTARQHLSRVATLACFEKNETICSPGEEMDRVYLVLGGEVRLDGNIFLKEGDSLGTYYDPNANLDLNRVST
eukprot:gene12601-15827_t